MTSARSTNEEAIQRWSQIPEDELASMDPDGDFAKRHLINPVIFRVLGDVTGKRILDAGCGQGYMTRLLARRGADMLGVEPARSPFDYAVAEESERPLGIDYIQADLSDLPELGAPFDAVIASMVFCSIPDWRRAMANCVRALRPGGLLIFSLNHPAFENLSTSWKSNGCLEVREYLEEYAIEGPNGTDWHRPLSVYVNALIGCGCRLREIIEPGLDPVVATDGPPGVEAYVHLPNFVLVAAERD